MNKRIFWTNICFFAAIFIASLCAVAIRYEIRRLQTEVAHLQGNQADLLDYGRRLNLEVATQLDLAELYRRAIDEQNLMVPGIGDGTLLFLETGAGQ